MFGLGQIFSTRTARLPVSNVNTIRAQVNDLGFDWLEKIGHPFANWLIKSCRFVFSETPRSITAGFGSVQVFDWALGKRFQSTIEISDELRCLQRPLSGGFGLPSCGNYHVRNAINKFHVNVRSTIPKSFALVFCQTFFCLLSYNAYYHPWCITTIFGCKCKMPWSITPRLHETTTPFDDNVFAFVYTNPGVLRL